MRWDAVIVGAGPAGLAAATYLGRFRRRALVLDGGPSRASWIPLSHNTPGFAHGVSGEDLVRRMREQALSFGAQIREGRAGELAPAADGFELDVGGEAIASAFVLLATGVVDRRPPLPGLDGALRAGVVRVCPICDAYEAIDRRIAVLGDGPLGLREARFLRTYSPQVTLLHTGPAEALEDLDAPGSEAIERIAVSPERLVLTGEGVELHQPQGVRRFDHLYLALGCEMNAGLARAWGAAHAQDGTLVVDAHQETSVNGIYAAGDVVRGLSQIAVAAAEAAIAATAIHNRLRDDPGVKHP